MGDKVDTATRLQVLQSRVQVFPFAFNPKAPDAHDQFVKERDAAKQGADLAGEISQAGKFDADRRAICRTEKARYRVSSMPLRVSRNCSSKTIAAAVDDFKAALANNPTDAVTATAWAWLIWG